MENFSAYMIKQLLTKFIIFDQLDFEFVHYCDKYLTLESKLPIHLYEHLSHLFWKYHPED